jgi:hypothetical protein
MLPVFINRCGAGRHVELIPSDYILKPVLAITPSHTVASES